MTYDDAPLASNATEAAPNASSAPVEVVAEAPLTEEIASDTSAPAADDAAADDAAADDAASDAEATDGSASDVDAERLWNAVSGFLRAGWQVGKLGARFSGKALKQLRDVADADVQALAAELPLFALSTAIPHSNEVKAKPATGIVQRPLVMIHGLSGSAGNVAALRLWINLHSPRPVHVFGYKMKADIEAVAADFEQWLMNVAAAYPDQQIDIIAHSMGGILSRSALQNPYLAQRLRRLVTLGSPHRGTYLARWGGNRFVTALRPDSSFVKRINTDEARANERAQLQIVSFWSRRDVMILPPENATLEGAWNIEMNDSTHMSWMFKPRMMARIVDVLDADDVEARIASYRSHDARVAGASTDEAQAEVS